MPSPKSLTTDAERVVLAREYFPFFLGWVHKTDAAAIFDGQAVPARHHSQMIEALERDGHTLIVAPRGSGKTTLVQAWIEWKLGRASLEGGDWANDFRVVWFSNTAHQAYRISNAIKATVEANEVYQAIFPKVKPHKEKWSQEEWKVAGNTIKDSNFLALGVGGPALGARALIMIFDDIADEENMRTSHQREQLVGVEGGAAGWLDNTAVPILVPWGRMVMSCTRWAWNDPAQWAMERKWRTLYMKALLTDEDGGQSSYWPERFSLDWLLRQQSQNPRAFAKQFQNEVMPEEGLIFERIWFEDRFDVPPSALIRVDSWDTASGHGRKRSYSAGLSAVVSADWHVYILNMLRGQLPYPDLREAVGMTAQRNKSNAVIIEAKSSGHALVQDDRLRGLPIVQWQPFGQKGSPTRAEANARISTVCAQRRLHLPSDFFCRRMGSEGWLPDFEREVFSYPEGENDDIVDALCQLLFWVEEQRVRYQAFAAQPRQPLRWGWGASRKVLV